MNVKQVLLVAALIAAFLGAKADAAVLLVPNSNNRISFQNAENLYDSTGAYKAGNSAPAIGDFLVGTFNITINSTPPGWASIPLQIAGLRDTYTGVFVQKITNLSSSGGVTTITLGVAQVGDPTTFTGGGLGDATSFDVAGELDYSLGEMMAIYHQGGGPAEFGLPLYSSTSGSVATDYATATSGTKYLTMSDGAGAPTEPNFYAFSEGVVPPGTFAITSHFGGYVEFNGTGFTDFALIDDPNVAGITPVELYSQSIVNFNVNGQFGGGPNPTSSWDFQSSDPTNILPLAPVPEPGSMLVWAGVSLASACVVARRRQRRAAV